MKAKTRNALSTGSFALPSKRKYPINDIAHARSALSYAAQDKTEGAESTVRAAVLKKYPSLKKDKPKLQKWKKG